MEKVLMDEEYAKVLYLPELKIGKVIWKRKPDIEEYKIPFLKLLDFGEHTPIDNFLSDIRDQGVVSPDHRKWFESYALPTAINECKLKRAATIFDGNIFKKYYLNMILQVTGKFNLPLKMFNTEEDAIEWIRKEMKAESQSVG
ncbi:MAG: hypothetical protein ACLFUW_05495 [Bacteroidales bacterium]